LENLFLKSSYPEKANIIITGEKITNLTVVDVFRISLESEVENFIISDRHAKSYSMIGKEDMPYLERMKAYGVKIRLDKYTCPEDHDMREILDEFLKSD
jgi:hypothetical protein